MKLFVADCLGESIIQIIEDPSVSEKSAIYRGRIGQVSEGHYANFGSYSRYFKAPHWTVEEVLVNSREIQNLWRNEHRKILSGAFFWRMGYQVSSRPYLRAFASYISAMHRTLIQQVEDAQPDVIILTDLHLYPSSVLKQLRAHCSLLVGHISSQLHDGTPIRQYDLVLSSIDRYLEDFGKMGLQTHKFLPAFDKTCLSDETVERDIDCVFVGSLYSGTPSLLNEVKKHVPQIQIYGPTLTSEMKDFGLEENYRGAVYGNEMYKILSRSKLVINRHGNPISIYGNVRTFEATGMGAGLLTEECNGLSTIFEPNQEVFTYKGIEDVGTRVRAILDRPSELNTVSDAGQRRTFREHTYETRYKDLERKISSLL